MSKYRICHDGSATMPYYIQKRRWFGLWTHFDVRGFGYSFFASEHAAFKAITEYLSGKRQGGIVRYV